jgi:hypothetical protein
MYEDKLYRGLEYESAFPFPHQTFRDDKLSGWNQSSRGDMIYLKRPVETTLLTLMGTSLLLGLTLSVMTVKSLLKLRT